MSNNLNYYLRKTISGANINNLSGRILARYKIQPIPLAIQKQLVAEAEKEEEIIRANERLIEIMEKNIEKVMSEI